MENAVIGNIISSGDLLKDHAVVYNDNMIVDLCPAKKIESGNTIKNIKNFGENYISAGFIDLQINGADGKLFQFDLKSLHNIESVIQQTGTCYYLPAISATDLEEYRSIRNAVRDSFNDLNGMLGIHYEGPYLNEKKPGFGQKECIGQEIIDYKDIYGDLIEEMVIMMTIAPEGVKDSYARGMIKDGVKLSLGHSNATLPETKRLIDIGVRSATHIFNGMPAISGRAPGITTACLINENIICSIIADGYHISPDIIKLIAMVKGIENINLISDGMPTIKSKNKVFSYRDNEIKLIENKLVDKNGTLSGTDKPILEMLEKFCKYLNLPVQNAIDVVTRNPAKTIGLSENIGDIKIGMTPSFTVFSKDFLTMV